MGVNPRSRVGWWYRRIRLVVLGALVIVLGAVWYARTPARLRLSSIDLPPGFTIAIYADSVPDARSLALGENGTLFVGTRSAGVVYAVEDTNRDNSADVV